VLPLLSFLLLSLFLPLSLFLLLTPADKDC
jgi:hypothetical protein